MSVKPVPLYAIQEEAFVVWAVLLDMFYLIEQMLRAVHYVGLELDSRVPL